MNHEELAGYTLPRISRDIHAPLHDLYLANVGTCSHGCCGWATVYWWSWYVCKVKASRMSCGDVLVDLDQWADRFDCVAHATQITITPEEVDSE